MALDISKLQEYVQDANILIGKLVNKDTVLRQFQAHDGYFPGQAVLRLYNAGGDLDDCCKVPEGTGGFDQVLIDVACIQSGNEFCEVDLAKYIRDAGMRFTAGAESAGSLEQVIMDQELAKVAKNIDILTFQGDTASANANLNKIDGLIKQANAVPAANKVTVSTGNVFDALSQIINAIPYEAFDMGDVSVFVGRDVAKSLQAALVAMNLYHYNPGQNAMDDVIAFPGVAGVKIVPTRGLDGTGKVIATPASNIHWLTNLEDDYQTASWKYTEYHELFYWRIKFLLGVGFGILDYVVLGTIAPAVLTTPYCINVCA